MNKIVFSLLLLCSLPLSLMAHLAADTLRAPLQFVDGKFVHTWGYDGTDVRQQALAVYPQAQRERLTVDAAMWKNRVEYLDVWKTFLPEFNVVGGGGDEQREAQGVPAYVGGMVAAATFLLTGEASYMDFIERSLYNAVPRALADTTKGRETVDRESAANFLMNVPEWIYATSADGRDLYVNLYTNATANLRLAGEDFTLDQITDMPRLNQVKLRLTKIDSTLTARVHVRIPDWAVGRNLPNAPFVYVEQGAAGGKGASAMGKTGAAVGQGLSTAGASAADEEDAFVQPEQELAIYVNGHRWTRTKVNEAGYVVIDRRWRSRDEIFITFPMRFRYLRRANSSGTPVRGALAGQYGPFVYALSSFPAGSYCSANLLPQPLPNQIGHDYPIYSLPTFDAQRAPQDAAAPRTDLPAHPYAELANGVVWWKEVK